MKNIKLLCKDISSIDMFTTKLFELDVPNKNGRIYSTDVAESIIENIDTDQKIFGHLGIQQGIDISNISHHVSDIRIHDGNLVGDITVLSTPKGIILKEIFEAGTKVDFRCTGIGDVNSDGVVTNYSLVSIDVVSDGS